MAKNQTFFMEKTSLPYTFETFLKMYGWFSKMKPGDIPYLWSVKRRWNTRTQKRVR